jgi:hypothetical protein
MNRLLDIGFQPSGHWLLEGEKLVHALTRHAAQRNVLYAFVCDGQVTYIGKTTQSLRQRMNGYRRPGATQATNVRNHFSLRAQLSQGVAVEILTLPDNGLLRYGQFHLNLAAGLEDDLIRVIDPPWNGGLVDDGIHPPAPPPAQVAETSEEPTELAVGSFTFMLRQTYFDQGFFNVGVVSQGLLGADSEPIDIYLPSSPQPVSGMINRRANHNGAPRIMGGVGLRQWFREEAAVGSEITVEVLSPTSIRLVTPAG